MFTFVFIFKLEDLRMFCFILHHELEVLECSYSDLFKLEGSRMCGFILHYELKVLECSEFFLSKFLECSVLSSSINWKI